MKFLRLAIRLPFLLVALPFVLIGEIIYFAFCEPDAEKSNDYWRAWLP